ncbi:MAG: hypothetical protein ABIE03_06610 [Patescibacteria group bacterium]|nr:hypothetical protein [Patescibacteria group bacterium]
MEIEAIHTVLEFDYIPSQQVSALIPDKAGPIQARTGNFRAGPFTVDFIRGAKLEVVGLLHFKLDASRLNYGFLVRDMDSAGERLYWLSSKALSLDQLYEIGGVQAFDFRRDNGERFRVVVNITGEKVVVRLDEVGEYPYPAGFVGATGFEKTVVSPENIRDLIHAIGFFIESNFDVATIRAAFR